MSRQNSNFVSRTQSFERSRRFIQSVSDIYGKDEMEELLDEIRHLEPCNFQSGDIQDFEINGSRHLQNTGESTMSMSVQSWDSHAVYRHRMDNMKAPVEVIQSILIHFRPSQCLEKLELFRLAFLTCCIGSLTCVYLSEWMYLSSFLVFIVLFSSLCTIWLLIADIIGIIYFLPISWPKFNTLLFLCIAVALLTVSSLLIHHVNLPSMLDEALTDDSRHFLYIAGILSLLASLLALIQSLMTSFGRPYPIWCSAYKAEPDCPSPMSPPGSIPGSPTERPVMATMAALAGMSSAVVATAPRLGNRNRSALHDRDQVPLRSVRNSVSWDDGVKPSNSRLKQLNEYPPLLNET
ncbi:uncharacterized protein LOC124344194 isoform X1 [Daphnia pulicaria]|uniref:uncharacterized protein LOC124344194 isoform X1 n=1 Tax=Daphnia pulicaria TaxID=35523 RepID=UPI001EEB043D|nr:uncharacterized protein LOC124344194 isoform X1 [Daphnia pulicaria]